MLDEDADVFNLRTFAIAMVSNCRLLDFNERGNSNIALPSVALSRNFCRQIFYNLVLTNAYICIQRV